MPENFRGWGREGTEMLTPCKHSPYRESLIKMLAFTVNMLHLHLKGQISRNEEEMPPQKHLPENPGGILVCGEEKVISKETWRTGQGCSRVL